MKIIYNDGHVDECPADDELHVIRHTAAHILAQAVKHLYPQAHFAYGPATEKGFHYDVDLGDVKLSDEDLKTVEKEMQAIVKQNLPIKPFALGREDAIKLMQERGEIYKVEHIGDLPEDATLTFYQQGDYIDMCVGPHLCYTKALKAFKLTALSGAYWKNDKNNKMLTRISGIAFRNQEELNEYLKMMEEAEKRDHRKIGKEMGLFMLCDEGPGFPFFLPKGMQLKNALIDYWRDIHYAADYVEVSTPMIMSRHLWETSGHWDHYKDNMYSTKIDDEDYCIKPMNCPGGVMVYRSQPHSYRDLPLRVGELGLVHRHELKGALHGLFRVRCFTQDDAHIFMTREQIPDEIAGVVHLINQVYSKFGFDYFVELSTRPADSMGSDEDWEDATNGLKTALEKLGMPYIVNEGDGAFYGPKIDEDYCIKPMNCPGGVMVYRSQPHSYRDLPLRVGELGLVHRHELKGALHGLFRVRCFTQDDAHIFMTREQIPDEIAGVVHLINQVYSKFGFDYFVELSTRPADSMGSDEDWEDATNGLKTALEKLGMPYIVNEGDGAFYGPKIDFHLRDCLGRTWQCGTIQLDFQMPLNFNLEYVDVDGSRKRPIMIHRVCYGSIERFIGILTEHFAGKFPTWMAPVQVKVLPVSDKSMDYAKTVYAALRAKKIRCELDDRNEKIGYKIREARQVDRVPYMLILGGQEVENNTVSVRDRATDQTVTCTLDEFIAKISKEIADRV